MSFDKELAEQNKDLIEEKIDCFLSNLRLLGNLTIDIYKRTMETFPEILSEDEVKCLARENEERVNKIANLSEMGIDSDPSEIEIEHKMRLPEAFAKLKKYIRVSYSLDHDSYDPSDFFTDEEKIHNGDSDDEESDEEEEEKEEGTEPLDETLLREAMRDNNKKRISLRHVTICKFIAHSYKYWDEIYNKNIDFLLNHLSSILPNNDFADKLEIIYIKSDKTDGDEEKDELKYISDKDLKSIWKIIHGSIKICLKYMKFIGRKSFTIKEQVVAGVKIEGREVLIDLDQEIEKWGVTF